MRPSAVIRAPVPEAPIHEDGEAQPGEGEIRAPTHSWKWQWEVDAESESETME